jgi:capsule polysaccharide export protein KpsE/RkpR
MPSFLELSFLGHTPSLKRIAAVTAICVALGTLYGFLAPRWYRSVLTVVPARQQRPGISSILGAELGGLAAGFDSSLGSSADVARIAAVLQSIGVTDAVVDKFNLKVRYGERYQEGAREALWRHCDVRTLTKPNLVQLSCEDTDPRFVQQMLDYFAGYGNQVFRRVGVSSASEEVRFLEHRVAELRQQADEVAARMREFQETHNIVDLDTQARAVVSAMASLNTQSITKQLELDYARTFSSGDEATMRQLRSQLSVVERRLRDLQQPADEGPQSAAAKQGPHNVTASGGLFPAALAVPKLRAEFEKLYRDRKVAEATLVFALERLEAAKADEARDVSTFFVLDPPALPTRRSRPLWVPVLVLFSALGLGAGLAMEWWRSGGRATVVRLAGASRTDASSESRGASRSG